VASVRAVGLCCGFGAGMLGGPLLWLRCDGASREIGERESKQRTGMRGWGWLGVARDGREQRVRREQRVSREQRVRREQMREVKWVESSSRVLENGLRKFFP
jgi:hypothetical protein